MTLYDALKKADEVRQEEMRLAVDACEMLRDATDPELLIEELREGELPNCLKNYKVTTSHPKSGVVLVICKWQNDYSFPAEALSAYVVFESQTITLCQRGLKHVFGRIPKTLYLSKVEKAK